MKKKTALIIIIFGILILGILFAAFSILNAYISSDSKRDDLATDFKNLKFMVSGETVTLHDGVAKVVSNLGGPKATDIKYFGNELFHDIDGDGQDDVVFLITQETGGSGTFFYLVGALKRDGGYLGTNAVFIGDRIAPQTTEAGEGRVVVVNYADRKSGDPFTAQPSVGKSLYLLFSTSTLDFGELVQNFEGEER